MRSVIQVVKASSPSQRMGTGLGAPVLPEEVRAELSLPEEDLGPITVSLVDFGQGHLTAEGAEIPFAGDWDLEITVRTSDIDQTIFEVVVPVA